MLLWKYSVHYIPFPFLLCGNIYYLFVFWIMALTCLDGKVLWVTRYDVTKNAAFGMDWYICISLGVVPLLQ